MGRGDEQAFRKTRFPVWTQPDPESENACNWHALHEKGQGWNCVLLCIRKIYILARTGHRLSTKSATDKYSTSSGLLIRNTQACLTSMRPPRFILASVLGLLATAGPTIAQGTSQKPNIIFILTDDQDRRMNSLDHMQKVQNLLIDQGTLYTRHYAPTALCCPARVSIWTGLHAHNHNVTDVGGVCLHNPIGRAAGS